MRILIVGTGMYVTGRDNMGPGTIVASIGEYAKKRDVHLTFYSRNESSKSDVEAAVSRINSMLNVNLKYSFHSSENGSLEDLLTHHKFDAAIVSVPDHLHFEICRVVLEHAIATLVVKPLTPTLNEAIDLVKCADDRGVYAAVEFHKRWDESNVLAKAKIQGDLIGKINYIDVNYSQRVVIPTKVFKDWAHKTNIFQYLGVHYVDLVYFLTGYYPFKVMAHGQHGILKEMGINTYDSVHVALVWRDAKNDHQFYSHYNINWIDPDQTSAMSDQKIKIVGTRGRVELDQKNRGIEFVSSSHGIQQMNPYFGEFLLNPDGHFYFNGYGCRSITTFLDDVLDIQNGLKKPRDLAHTRPSFKSSMVSTAVLDKVNESLSHHSQWIAFNDKIWNTI